MECPEHELGLMPIDRLPRVPERILDRVTVFADPRLNRGTVLIGPFLVLVGFFVPFVSATGVAAAEISASALEVAIDGADNLWLTPGAALAILWVVWRRPTRSALRAARAAVFGLAVGGSVPLFYTTRRIALVADGLAAIVEWHWGLWLMLAGLLLVALGAPRLGKG